MFAIENDSSRLKQGQSMSDQPVQTAEWASKPSFLADGQVEPEVSECCGQR